MFKKHFSGLTKSKSPRPEELILKAMRERLLPLCFNENYDPQYHQSGFLRDNLSVHWSVNLKDEHFYFMLKEQDRVIVTMNSPWYIKIDENKWGEFKEQVLEALDDWLKTI